ncbi:MAG: outer membrane beta-barrel protein [bacterium]|nr:outer membrane beta-barrel protein [bacterium]
MIAKICRVMLMVALALSFSMIAWAENDVTFSGFVDASYSGNLDDKVDTFSLDCVEFDIERTVGEDGAVRADLDWVYGTPTEDNSDPWEIIVEQAFLSYNCQTIEGLTFTFGRFNAPIGFEFMDAPDMYQFSHALVYDHGLPGNLSGIMVSTELENGFSGSAYFVNGWDNNVISSSPATLGGHLAYAMEDFGVLGASAIMGTEFTDEDPDLKRTIFDFDLTIDAVDNLLIGGEFNIGKVEQGADTEWQWKGFMAMFHYDFNDFVGFTGRYDWFDDTDMYAFGAVDVDGEDVAQTWTAMTFAPTFVLGDGMGALIEFRIDSSSEEIYADSDGEPKTSTTSVAFEMTYTF